MVFRESRDYFGSLEGAVSCRLFKYEIPAVAKKCGEGYARRAADFVANLPESIADTLIKATLAYLIDLLDEHEGEFELPVGFYLDEDSKASDIIPWLEPQQIVFDKGILSDEEAPPAFSMRLCFSPVPDEQIEWVIRDDTVVYVGEYNDTSPWNDKIMKKKWNCINRI